MSFDYKVIAITRFLPAIATAVIAATMLPDLAAQEPVVFDTGMENQAGLTFSPDGATAYWVAWNGTWGGDATSRRTIYTSRQQNGVWSEPSPAPFSGDFEDDDPFASPDGQWVYFVSERPASEDDTELDADIWRYSLIEANRLERLSVNSSAAEYSPIITASGALYFASAREGGYGKGDLYRAGPSVEGFLTAEPLGPAVNSQTGEWNLWVATDESELLFEASSRPTNVSIPGDLYYSWRTPAGWTPAMPVGNLNTGGSDLLPRLHPDGETLYYVTAPIGGHARIAAASWPPLKARLRSDYAPILLVANRASHEITFLDISHGRVMHRIATGEGPHLLSNISDGRVLATGFGVFPEPHTKPVNKRPPFVEVLNARLILVDVVNRSLLLDTHIESCARPHASWLVGTRGFVTCEDEQRVLEINLENGSTVRHFDTLQKGSHVLSFEPESRTLAATNPQSGSITLIDIDTGVTRVVELAAGSEGALAIDGRIWVGNALDGSVSIVDPRTASVLEHIGSICSFPIALSADAQKQVWVACFGSAELVAIDRDSLKVQRRISLDGQPLHVLMHPQRPLAYVSLPRENAVAEIDLYTGKVVRRMAVGIEPDGLRWGR